ncbi:hypothetical protein MWU50_04360 [Flavobacteriaceae bacterium S0862]|nr:hypothetical protein [Flavobacteriaceae bacterium S0862]
MLIAIDSNDFKETVDRKEVGFFFIKNKHSVEASFTNYVQCLISLYVPDRD